MSRPVFSLHLLQLAAIGIICFNSAAAQQDKQPQPSGSDTKQEQKPEPAKPDAKTSLEPPKITNGPFLLDGSTKIQAAVDKSIGNDNAKVYIQINDNPPNGPWRKASFSQSQASTGTFVGQVSEAFKSGEQVEIGEGDSSNPIWSQPVTVTTALGRPSGLFLRTIVGINQTGATSAQSSQQFFLDLYTSTPLNLVTTKGGTAVSTPDLQNLRSQAARGGAYDLGFPLRIWGDLRIESAPQQITSTVSQLSSSFGQTVGNLTTNQVARSFEFLGGLELRVLETQNLNLSFARNSSERVTISLIAAGGLITPLSANDSATIYTVPQNQPNFFQAYPQAMEAKFVVFTVPNRTRFFREAYGGLRFRTQSFDVDGFASRRKLAANFDVTYGFNESVTGGTIYGGVVRIDGFVPIPVSLKPFSSVYFFGASNFRLVKSKDLPTFLLNSAASGTSFADPGAVVIPAQPTNRDFYRVGIGIDLIKLLSSWNPAKAQ